MKDLIGVSRGMGLVQDTPHRRMRYKRYQATSSALVSTSLAKFEGRVLDQGQTSSCEGHRAAQAIFVATGGSFKGMPSPRGIYTLARCLERVTSVGGLTLTLPPLQDNGCMTSSVVDAISTLGIMPLTTTVDGRYSDVSLSNVNAEPTLTEMSLDRQRLETGEYIIEVSSIPDLVSSISEALSRGWPVGLDVYVDRAFEMWGEDWVPSKAPLGGCNMGEPGGGGHAILCTELSVSSSGEVLLSGLNSWGDSWGAPALSGEGPNSTGHWRGNIGWLSQAVLGAIVFECHEVDQ